ncbi:MAG: iron uptake porin [Chamaesiphon sp.]|nr:iron uptake porin [Chamaesiphon sp.]
MKRQLNWLKITAGSMFATILLISGAQAAESLVTIPTSANSNLIANHTPSDSLQLVAARKKKSFKKKKKVKSRPKTTATAPTTTTPETLTTDLTQITPPPAPPTPPTPPVETPTALVAPPAPVEPPKAEAPAPNQFSTTTQLQGQVIFGATGTVGGDFSRNTAFGARTRLELKTDLGGGTLTTRLQAVGLGLSNQSPTAGTAVATPEGSLSWTDGTTTNSIGVDALKYEFAISPETQVVVAANAGASDDFTDTINPYFDGDGASGSISAFGNRPSIYYTVQGAGVGIRHKLSENTELSVGYLASTSNDPAVGNGLFGGSYGALAQLTFKTGENSKVGVTYTRTLNANPGTGSNNANPELAGNSNNFGLQGSFQLSPELALGGWVGYTQNQAAGGDRQIWNWAVTAAAPDFGGKGNLAGFLVGQEPRVASSSDGTTDPKSGLHIEGFYQMKINDNLSITPGLIYLTAPNQAPGNSAVIGALRSTFSF